MKDPNEIDFPENLQNDPNPAISLKGIGLDNTHLYLLPIGSGAVPPEELKQEKEDIVIEL